MSHAAYFLEERDRLLTHLEGLISELKAVKAFSDLTADHRLVVGLSPVSFMELRFHYQQAVKEADRLKVTARPTTPFVRVAMGADGRQVTEDRRYRTWQLCAVKGVSMTDQARMERVSVTTISADIRFILKQFRSKARWFPGKLFILPYYPRDTIRYTLNEQSPMGHLIERGRYKTLHEAYIALCTYPEDRRLPLPEKRIFIS